MNETNWLEFDCQQCGELIEAKSNLLGKEVGCPCCRQVTKMELPNAAPLADVRKAAPRRGPNGNDVPVKMGLGKMGSFETTVSKNDAGRMAHTFLGGLMVALGMIVCIVFKIKPPKVR